MTLSTLSLFIHMHLRCWIYSLTHWRNAFSDENQHFVGVSKLKGADLARPKFPFRFWV